MDERMERIRSTTEAGTRRAMETAQEAAERAGSYVQQGAGRVVDRAHDLAADARDQVERLTGRPLEAWTAELRHYVREHPLQAVAITVAIGYVLGKLFQRE